MNYSYYKVKDNWEQARLISFLIAQTNSTKKLTFEDVIKFCWDKEEDEKPIIIKKNDAERLKMMADNYLKTKQIKDDGTN